MDEAAEKEDYETAEKFQKEYEQKKSEIEVLKKSLESLS